MDVGYGSCWLKREDVARSVMSVLQELSLTVLTLHAWVIMPNHMHVLMTPDPNLSLGVVINRLKGPAARRANVILGRTGTFWARDYFDRYIRADRHFNRCLDYINYNPVRAGLSATAAAWPFGSAHGRGEE